jgi:hypothetical protein
MAPRGALENFGDPKDLQLEHPHLQSGEGFWSISRDLQKPLGLEYFGVGQEFFLLA